VISIGTLGHLDAHGLACVSLLTRHVEGPASGTRQSVSTRTTPCASTVHVTMTRSPLRCIEVVGSILRRNSVSSASARYYTIYS
jgi:hypothetical protein